MRARMNAKFRSRLVPVSELESETRGKMYALFSDHFEDVHRDRFDQDLAAKQWALLLEGEPGQLLGFTSLRLDRRNGIDFPASRETVDIVYSGDTIVAREARTSPLLSSAWIAAVQSLAEGRRVLWFLLVSGWRTYRFLPIYWREFYPCWNRPMPDAVKQTMETLASERFGQEYDRERGVVRFSEPQVLRSENRGIPANRRRDPHVEFFARVNPGHEAGDELVCLTEITDSNLTNAGRRMVGERLEQE